MDSEGVGREKSEFGEKAGVTRARRARSEIWTQRQVLAE